MLTNLLRAAQVKSPEMTTPPPIIVPKIRPPVRLASARACNSGTASFSP